MSAANTEYEVSLSQFVGPLDLLLHLVRKAEIDLKDIFVSEITEQYLHFMHQVDTVDLDRACDFLETASLLLFIKSRALLPVPPKVEEPDEPDPAAALIEQLRLYEAYKNASEFLRDREKEGSNFLSKPPEDPFPESSEDTQLSGDAQMLLAAFERVLRRRAKKRRTVPAPLMQIEADLWDVGQQKRKIMGMLRNAPRVTFTQFFPDEAPAMEIAVTFSALLELWNAEEVQLEQHAAFGEITVHAVDKERTGREAG